MTPARRSSYRRGKLSYAEVGASQLPDLLQFPPNGAAAFCDAAKLGSGTQRFVAAQAALLSGDALLAAGCELPEKGTTPVRQGQQEVIYGADGEAYLATGEQIITATGAQRRSFTVVRIATGAQQAVLVLGTADEGSYTGEVSLAVELREDDSVWAFARGFWHDHAKRFLGLGESGPQQGATFCEQILRALSPTAQLTSRGEVDAATLARAGITQLTGRHEIGVAAAEQDPQIIGYAKRTTATIPTTDEAVTP
ncbi:DUF1990 family protein [Leucobacter sp. OH2974_COT-288]|nr:DUF1990 family protein [Leucobacter sp. OH2974_COT-288]